LSLGLHMNEIMIHERGTKTKKLVRPNSIWNHTRTSNKSHKRSSSRTDININI
jgi:hypothetical protein